jgi:hypothetical protein
MLKQQRILYFKNLRGAQDMKTSHLQLRRIKQIVIIAVCMTSIEAGALTTSAYVTTNTSQDPNITTSGDSTQIAGQWATSQSSRLDPSHYSELGLNGGNASGSALAGVGSLKAVAYASAFGGMWLDTVGYASAYSGASIYDTFMITAPGMDGKQGEVSFDLYFDFTGQSIIWNKPTGSSGVSLLANVGGASLVQTYTHDFSSNTELFTACSIENGGQYLCENDYKKHTTLSTKFFFGQDINIQLILGVSVQGSSSLTQDPLLGTFSIDNRFTATADASHSAYWGGIQNVTVDGSRLSNYQIASSSGADWARSYIPAVPEPSTWLMAVSGVALISMGRNRRRNRA